MIKAGLVLMVGALLLSGCVNSEVYIMQNPKTGEIQRCGSNEHGNSPFPIAQAEMDNSAARNCAKGYEAAGWKKMN